MRRRGITISQEEDEVLTAVMEKMDEDIIGKTKEISEQANQERMERQKILQRDEGYIEGLSDEDVRKQFYTE